MSKTRMKKAESFEVPQKDRAAEIANTFEWLTTAFILAFVFRVFVMEAFRIPTGSMADTLMGAHFRLCCPQCGYKYDYGFIPESYGFTAGTIPTGYVRPVNSRCPSCGHYQQTGGHMPIASGDGILVLKWIYQFFEPKQWDVVVFRNPLEPEINYIKRLVGRPGETVEIIDGDIYINGQISRKPANVQNELWMPVYDNDYQPIRPAEPSFNRHKWQQPLKNVEGSKWAVPEGNPTKFCLDSPPGQVNSLFYDTSIGNDFRATYAYDDISEYEFLPYCSDLKTRFYVCWAEPQGGIGAGLSKYGNNYKAWIDFSGEMAIAKVSDGGEMVLAQKRVASAVIKTPVLVEFANVDHRLIFRFGGETLTCDLGRSPNDAGPRDTNIQPQVQIFGSGKLTISHIAIFRDIHYTGKKYAASSELGRAVEGNPLALQKDEFFVLGDNSPGSLDGRWWDRPGKGNRGLLYREGIVPREYMVGKALFVYGPGGFDPPGLPSFKMFLFKSSRHSRLAATMYAVVSWWKCIPNVGQMRFIYGGSDKEQQNL